MTARRTLTDSEARWAAVCFIDAATRQSLEGGGLSTVEWTDDDHRLVEKHIYDRLAGLLRRPRAEVTTP